MELTHQAINWYNDMGVDEVMGESAEDRTIKKTPPSSQAKMKPVPILKSVDKNTTLPNPTKMTINTRQMATDASSLEELRQCVENFTALSITKTATNTVFSDGQPTAKIMFVGEAPGADEDLRGIPFCGASGQLLDQMLKYIGLDREKNFYITNTLFWRPPGNRRPTPEELAVCAPFVEKHVALLNPDIIILVGGTAITALLGKTEGISKLRGKFYQYTNEFLDHSIPTTAIFHPSYLLRSPGQKRYAWSDLLQLKQYLTENNISH